MYEFHQNINWYFEMQTLNANKSVIPFIEKVVELKAGMKVLEVGCAEGGVIKAFVNRGCEGVGVELDDARLQNAIKFNQELVNNESLKLISKNIYDESFEDEFSGQFDIIILKDVIEHIYDQDKIIAQLKKYLKPNSYIFFGFPPFNMPYGGHQQVAKNKIFSKIPYTHLLPMSMYVGLMRLFNEAPEQFIEVKETGISTSRFERIVKEKQLTIANQTHFLFNPIYEFKFGLMPKVQFSIITAIPHLRDFLTTCVFYLVKN